MIAIVGCLGVAVEISKESDTKWPSCDEMITHLKAQLQRLIDARPTAVNMKKEAESLLKFCEYQKVKDDSVVEKFRLRFKLFHNNVLNL